ncbi:hypothetical protein COOONC_11947, partial [Cooperia oncophora]
LLESYVPNVRIQTEQLWVDEVIKSYWFYRCETPICQNFGYVKNGVCQCLIDYTGTFCELPVCTQKYDATFTDTGRTFVIMLETSYNMGSTIFQMKKNLKTALDSIQNDTTTKGWFSKFILYPFD